MSLYPPEDLWVWLRRFGEIFCPLKKIVDDRGIWTGGWSVSVRLSVDRITVFYPGQLKVCHKCGVKGHFSSSCPEQKCSLCQKLGHLARDWLEDPSLLDSEDPIISTNLREEELEEMQNDAGPDVEEEVEVVQNDVGPHVNGEAPERGVQPSLDLQWCRHTLDAIVQNLQRLQECIQDVLRDIERVNHMFSF
ncbi:hypothetical protein AB205_0054780 [Aquarana catesbeiana]|uniref:CCHC-type domain-containing protein n=1 Tax=Aquarana catesbeiana TaxID=8400 RepID=A0A2G9RK04_AQUCT|nr:hypothetical protein AB205_0054780 [Aquarana catesbeiana]